MELQGQLNKMLNLSINFIQRNKNIDFLKDRES